MIMSASDAPTHTTSTPDGLETKPLYAPGELTWQAQLAQRYDELDLTEDTEQAAS